RMNRLKALPNEILMMTTNLPSGYQRDLQIIKEHLFPAFGELKSCIEMTVMMLSQANVKADLLKDPKYLHLFTVEEVNRLVLEGVPFRDAYQQVGRQVEAGEFSVPTTRLNHTHEGSLGNLCLPEIKASFGQVLARFEFAPVAIAFKALLTTSG
ncbi:MAG: argininosuccinate lyase, partial [Bdellovibrionales bacterium]|nr:argininosuccinate lyase [Oligoflexia bacterium]